MAIKFRTILLVAAAVALVPATVMAVELYADGKSEADVRADSVVRCQHQMGEFGAEAIDICVQGEDAARAELAAYPDEFFDIVRRCSRMMYQAGWTRIKRCSDNDIQARDALAAYPRKQAALIAECREKVGQYGQAQVKACVDEHIARSAEDDSQ